jgi:dienelactone hydrolase
MWGGTVAALALAFAFCSASASAADESASRYRVGTRVETFVDDTRSTPPTDGSPALPTRTLRTFYWYPARGDTSDGDRKGARPARGRFPVILFSHGQNAQPTFYRELLRQWAAAGYVVIAPEYPLSVDDAPEEETTTDRFQQPADATFVLDRSLDLPWIARIVDADHVAAIGHSLGGHTTFQLAYGDCCRDPRIDAAIALAGAGYGEGGTVDDTTPPPLLLVHDRNDRAVSHEEALRTFDEFDGPRLLLTVHESLDDLAHLLPYLGGPRPVAELVTAATLDFLARYLGGDDEALHRLCRGPADPRTGRVRSAGTPPPCPSQG